MTDDEAIRFIVDYEPVPDPDEEDDINYNAKRCGFMAQEEFGLSGFEAMKMMRTYIHMQAYSE